jgi:hypothetical protein
MVFLMTRKDYKIIANLIRDLYKSEKQNFYITASNVEFKMIQTLKENYYNFCETKFVNYLNKELKK